MKRSIIFGGLTGFFGVMISVSAQYASADQLTFSASKDSFLRRGAHNTNEGGNKKLNIRRGGKRRALVAFDLSTLTTQIPAGEEVIDAELKLTVTDNGKTWGKLGRLIGAHMLLADWTEGNGTNSRPPRAGETDDDEGEESDTKKNKGSGSGVTWNCATDSNIGNGRADCLTKWKGSSHNSTPTDTTLITNTTAGEITFDVTGDVRNFVANTFPNFGWLIRRTTTNKAGTIWVASSEATAGQPSLVVTTGYAFDLTGAAEVPPVTTTATGSCEASLNDAETVLTVNCTHTIQSPTAAHIHQAVVGVDGSVVCDLGSATSPISTTCNLNAGLLTALRAGELYVNIHTAANSGGELRGQIE